MSNPSPEKALVVLQSEQAKEDPRGVHTSEQQAEERCRDVVHQARTEQTKGTEQKEPVVPAENKESGVKLSDGISKNFITDRSGHQKEVKKVPAGYHKIEDSTQAKSGTTYPEAQPSYDAKGNLNHIDIMPNLDYMPDKVRSDKNSW